MMENCLIFVQQKKIQTKKQRKHEIWNNIIIMQLNGV